MPAVEVVSNEEQMLWNDRKKEVQEHASYKIKQQYFPNNMDEWEEKGKEIEIRYHNEIIKLNKKRKEEDDRPESVRPPIKPKCSVLKNNKTPRPTLRHSLRQVAQSLLELKTPR